MTKPVVIPLDGSEQALVALPVARRLAALEGAALHLVHVAPEIAAPAEVLERIGLDSGDLRGLVLQSKVGAPAPGILEAAGELGAALIVMCTRSSADSPLGNTSLAVLKAAPCPVVFVHPDAGMASWELRRILLPHDGTPVTSAAIGPAAELARRSGAGLDVLHVAAPGAQLSIETGTFTPPRYIDQPQHEWPAWVDEFIERLSCCCQLESLEVRMALAPGVPGDEILRFAAEHDSDLIVLAWRGAWGDHGATIKAVLGRAASPVMVIRTANEPRAD